MRPDWFPDARLWQNSFYALYRSFTECVFVEEEGGIVFYKNKYGEAAREVAQGAAQTLKHAGWSAEAQDQLCAGELDDRAKSESA